MASEISINLDIRKDFNTVIKCKQNDDLPLEVNLFANGEPVDLTNKEIIINGTKDDNTYVKQNTGITKKNNIFNVDYLDRDFTRVPGTTKTEVVLLENGKQDTTFTFYLAIQASVLKGAVQSSNTVTILEELDNKTELARQVKEETEQLIENGGAATTGQVKELNASLEQMEQKKAPISYVDSKIGNIGNSKTFKGISLFSALPTSNNTNGDYWYVTDKSTNYCWNGTSWIDIGNNVNVGDNTVTTQKTDFAKEIYNRFFNNMLPSGRINKDNGNLETDTAWTYTTYIKVEQGEMLYHNFNLDLFACYDVNKTFIPQSTTLLTKLGTSTNRSFTVPTNVKYMRFSASNQEIIDRGYMFLSLSKDNKTKRQVKIEGVYTQDEIDAIIVTKTKNLYSKPITIIKGSYVNKDGGNIVTNSGWGRTDFVEVESGENLYTNFNNTIFACYDVNKTFISQATTGLTSLNGYFTVPNNVKYMIFSVGVEIVDTCYVSKRPLYDGQYGSSISNNIFFSGTNIYKKSMELDVFTDQALSKLSDLDYITCWGDSLTAQGTWTRILKQASGLPLYNFGVGGESSNVIASRQGGLSIEVNNITIPATTDKVLIGTNNLIACDGTSVRPLLQGEGGGYTESANSINPCFINGVECTLSYIQAENKYYINRNIAGSEVIINRPTQIITNAMKNYNKGIMTIFMGQNDGVSNSIDNYIRLHKLMLQFNQSKNKRFIVIVRHTGTSDNMKDLESAVVKEFGRNAILLRPYLSQYGCADGNISPTQTDLNAMAVGSCPPSLLTDDIHFNDIGKTVIGNYIVKRMKELCYI